MNKKTLFIVSTILSAALAAEAIAAKSYNSARSNCGKKPSMAFPADTVGVTLERTPAGYKRRAVATTSGEFGFRSVPNGNYKLKIGPSTFGDVHIALAQNDGGKIRCDWQSPWEQNYVECDVRIKRDERGPVSFKMVLGSEIRSTRPENWQGFSEAQSQTWRGDEGENEDEDPAIDNSDAAENSAPEPARGKSYNSTRSNVGKKPGAAAGDEGDDGTTGDQD